MWLEGENGIRCTLLLALYIVCVYLARVPSSQIWPPSHWPCTNSIFVQGSWQILFKTNEGSTPANKCYNKMSTLTLRKTVSIGKWLPHVLKKEQVVHVHVSWPGLYKYTHGGPIPTKHATRKNGPLQRVQWRRQQPQSSASSRSQISAWGEQNIC